MSQLIHAVSVLLIACTTGVIGPGRSGGFPGAHDAPDTRGERNFEVKLIHAAPKPA